jgi:hypothetical protein
VAGRIFVLEAYLPRTASGGLAATAARASSVTEAMRREGMQVRFLRSFFMPDDETCFHVFEAVSDREARSAGARAGISADRVLEAIDIEVTA